MFVKCSFLAAWQGSEYGSGHMEYASRYATKHKKNVGFNHGFKGRDKNAANTVFLR